MKHKELYVHPKRSPHYRFAPELPEAQERWLREKAREWVEAPKANPAKIVFGWLKDAGKLDLSDPDAVLSDRKLWKAEGIEAVLRKAKEAGEERERAVKELEALYGIIGLDRRKRSLIYSRYFTLLDQGTLFDHVRVVKRKADGERWILSEPYSTPERAEKEVEPFRELGCPVVIEDRGGWSDGVAIWIGPPRSKVTVAT